MKREKWNQKTDLRQDPAESVPGVYEEKSEYTLEEILSEFSGDWDSGTVDQTVWDGEALSMSEFDPYLFDTYEQPAVKPAANRISGSGGPADSGGYRGSGRSRI